MARVKNTHVIKEYYNPVKKVNPQNSLRSIEQWPTMCLQCQGSYQHLTCLIGRFNEIHAIDMKTHIKGDVVQHYRKGKEGGRGLRSGISFKYQVSMCIN